jgi:hypothetical protein
MIAGVANALAASANTMIAPDSMPGRICGSTMRRRMVLTGAEGGRGVLDLRVELLQRAHTGEHHERHQNVRERHYNTCLGEHEGQEEMRPS